MINQNLPTLQDAETKEKVLINQYIELTNGKKILFEEGGRLALVRLQRITHLAAEKTCYLLIDCSESMIGEGLLQFARDFPKCFPFYVRTLML